MHGLHSEAQLANLCDEIAYNNHDVDDGLRSGLITIEQLLSVDLFKLNYELVQQSYSNLSSRRQTHEIIRRIINQQVSDLLDTTYQNILLANPSNIGYRAQFNHHRGR